MGKKKKNLKKKRKKTRLGADCGSGHELLIAFTIAEVKMKVSFSCRRMMQYKHGDKLF